MIYKNVQFVSAVVYSRAPWLSMNSALSPEYVIEDDGPTHLRIQAPSKQAVRVPWSNVASAEILDIPGTTVVKEIIRAPDSTTKTITAEDVTGSFDEPRLIVELADLTVHKKKAKRTP